jgi:hypothetical protein
MNLAFTICSANYLPFAKSLADSVIRHNPTCRFVITLADTFSEYDASFFAPHLVIPVANMNLPHFAEMNSRYNIFELSCALKPFVADYLFETNEACKTLFYFDADILVFGSLHEAETLLLSHSILLTPHIATPLSYEDSVSKELNVLRTGLYNAGFFGLQRTSEALAFLQWWQQRLRYHCFDNAANGLFVDQLWLGLVPLYFHNSFVLYNPAYNLAYWNFSERKLTVQHGTYFVNESHKLVFFHYSGYDIHQPEQISKHKKDLTFQELPEYKTLYDFYIAEIKRNNQQGYLNLPVTLGRKKKKKFLGLFRM